MNKFISLLGCFVCGSLFAVSPVTYEKFGAKGDGKTDDRAAIVKAHAEANRIGAPVKAKAGATYYLGPDEGTAIIKTDVDWGTAKFIIDDVGVTKLWTRAFRIEASAAPVEITDLKPFKKGAKRLEGSLPGACFLIVENANVRRYIRKGLNSNDGFAQKEVLCVRKDGTVDPATPVIWDFDAVTKATAYPIDAKPLTVKGGSFLTIANQAESKYKYHNRGIQVLRSNVTLSGIRHEITGEGDHGAPYGGFIQIEKCANVTVKDCVLTGHKTYYTAGHGGTVPMGSYDLTVNDAVNASVRNCRQTNDITDSRYWGIFASNYSKNILFDHCEFSRFDAHMGVANATIRNSTLGYMGVHAIGHGIFRIENTTVKSQYFIELRPDYGSTWDGDFLVKDCTLELPKGLKWGGCIFTASNDGTHDFGYPCTLPRKVVLDGFTIDDRALGPNVSATPVFKDFNPKLRSADYQEKFPYTVTEEVVMKNVKSLRGKTVALCPNAYPFRNTKVTH